MLVSMRELLVRAKDGKYAVAAANVFYGGERWEACFCGRIGNAGSGDHSLHALCADGGAAAYSITAAACAGSLVSGRICFVALLSFIMKKSMRS